jgi:hypothetical protein
MDACKFEWSSVQECMKGAGNDASACQYAMEMFNQCKRQSKSVCTPLWFCFHFISRIRFTLTRSLCQMDCLLKSMSPHNELVLRLCDDYGQIVKSAKLSHMDLFF